MRISTPPPPIVLPLLLPLLLLLLLSQPYALAADACGRAAEAINAAILKPSPKIDASVAVACLKSLPLDRAAALQLTTELRRYLAFYSAATYVLHQPCPELDVPPVDINATLSAIEARIRQSPAAADPEAAGDGGGSGGYTRAYDVHRDLMQLFGAIKDGHVQFLPVCVAGAFVFTHDYPLVQLADRPDALPHTYVATLDPVTLLPKPGQLVLAINGRDPALFLADQARSDPESSWTDPDARLNELLMHLNSGGWSSGLFASRLLYPDAPLQLTLACRGGQEQAAVNVTVRWMAEWVDPRPGAQPAAVPFTDAKSFQRAVCERSDDELDALDVPLSPVVGPPPASKETPLHSSPDAAKYTAADTKNVTVADTKNVTAADTKAAAKADTEASTEGDTAAGPAAAARLGKRAFWPDDVAWGGSEFGEVGYYQLDAKTAVLVVLSFTPIDPATAAAANIDPAPFTANFSMAVAQALALAKAAGSERLLVDVMGNGGGMVPLGYNLVRQLFPAAADHDRVFFGTNLRWNPALDAMLVRGDPAAIAASYFDLGVWRREDGRDWASFREMLGPVHRHGDYFSLVSVPDEAEMDADAGGQVLHDFPRTPPFAADQVVLVSSGLCGSTCAIAAEALLALGVRAVTFGGRPRIGPSQAVGGVKGSQVVSFDEVFVHARAFLAPTVAAAAVPAGNFSAHGVPLPGPLRLRTVSARINLLNSWRRHARSLPIEFLYTPTQWRLFYTPDMLTRITAVYAAAAGVAWGGQPDVSGGPYTPVNGLDGSGFKWPDDSGGGGGAAGSGYAEWDSLGQLIWKVIQG